MLTSPVVSLAVRESGLGEADVTLLPLAQPEAVVRVSAGRRYVAASMIKVPIAAVLCRAIARGELDPSERVRIGAEVVTENDAASPLVLGAEATLDDLGRLAVVRSDNVATNALIDRLGRERLTREAAELGLGATIVRRKLTGGEVPVHDLGATGRNAHPPEDATHLFVAVARRAFPGADRLAGWLTAQEWNDKLSRGLEPGDRFAHKTGDTSEASHDGGILDLAGGARYVVVVYTTLPSSPESDARLGAFMGRVRPLLG